MYVECFVIVIALKGKSEQKETKGKHQFDSNARKMLKNMQTTLNSLEKKMYRLFIHDKFHNKKYFRTWCVEALPRLKYLF